MSQKSALFGDTYGIDFHPRSLGQLGYGNGCSSRKGGGEEGRVNFVHQWKVIHGNKVDRGLHDVLQAKPCRLHHRLKIGQGLASLSVDSTGHHLARLSDEGNLTRAEEHAAAPGTANCLTVGADSCRGIPRMN